MDEKKWVMIAVSLSFNDVEDLTGMDREESQEFMFTHKDTLRDIMVEAGKVAVCRLSKGEE